MNVSVSAPAVGASVPDRDLRIALVGNPNSGKTALFNALTGGRAKVANYAGVTVERKEGFLTTPGGRRGSVLDLPGT
jgi:ferrous iron transport protein B